MSLTAIAVAQAEPETELRRYVLEVCLQLVAEGVYPTGRILQTFLPGRSVRRLTRIRIELFGEGKLDLSPVAGKRWSRSEDVEEPDEPHVTLEYRMEIQRRIEAARVQKTEDAKHLAPSWHPIARPPSIRLVRCKDLPLDPTWGREP